MGRSVMSRIILPPSHIIGKKNYFFLFQIISKSTKSPNNYKNSFYIFRWNLFQGKHKTSYCKWFYFSFLNKCEIIIFTYNIWDGKSIELSFTFATLAVSRAPYDFPVLSFRGRCNNEKFYHFPFYPLPFLLLLFFFPSIFLVMLVCLVFVIFV
jgi:hypothetical protein